METALAERDADSIYSVTELANLLGITPRAIRFYESKGLMSPRRAGTIRVYNYYDHGHLQITLRGSICMMPTPARANSSRCRWESQPATKSV